MKVANFYTHSRSKLLNCGNDDLPFIRVLTAILKQWFFIREINYFHIRTQSITQSVKSTTNILSCKNHHTCANHGELFIKRLTMLWSSNI